MLENYRSPSFISINKTILPSLSLNNRYINDKNNTLNSKVKEKKINSLSISNTPNYDYILKNKYKNKKNDLTIKKPALSPAKKNEIFHIKKMNILFNASPHRSQDKENINSNHDIKPKLEKQKNKNKKNKRNSFLVPQKNNNCISKKLNLNIVNISNFNPTCNLLNYCNLNNNINKSYVLKNNKSDKAHMNRNNSYIQNNNEIKYNLKNYYMKDKKSTPIKLLLLNNYSQILKKLFCEFFCSEYPNTTYRKSMEDTSTIIQSLANDLNKSYFAIFDGHGGSETSQYLKENMHLFLSRELYKSNNIENCLINSFNNIDTEISRNNKINKLKKISVNQNSNSNLNEFSNSNSNDSSQIDEDNIQIDSGSTATVVLIAKELNKTSMLNQTVLYCANVGDSKCFLYDNEKKALIQISKDHKCSDENEVDRIKKLGGVIFNNRVFGVLNLTRSIGDGEMKKCGVISTPDVCKVETKGMKFCIIATDGLWDFVGEEDVTKYCQEYDNAKDLTNKLIEVAVENDTRDNVSCIVIKF